jgi:peptidoglycan hydrolase CwlO-like protein
LNEKLQIIEEQLSLNQKNFTNQVNSLNDEKKNLESFMAQKAQDFLQMTNYLKSSDLKLMPFLKRQKNC